MEAQKVEARVDRLLEQLEDPHLTVRQIELIEAKVKFLESLKE